MGGSKQEYVDESCGEDVTLSDVSCEYGSK